jgi:hypothetical protein
MKSIFALTDNASPVLDYVEAATHPANTDSMRLLRTKKWLPANRTAPFGILRPTAS